MYVMVIKGYVTLTHLDLFKLIGNLEHLIHVFNKICACLKADNPKLL